MRSKTAVRHKMFCCVASVCAYVRFPFEVITWIPVMQGSWNLVCYLPDLNPQLYSRVALGSSRPWVRLGVWMYNESDLAFGKWLLPYGQRAKCGGICVLWTHALFKYYISYCSHTIAIDSSSNMSPKETVCMKCQTDNKMEVPISKNTIHVWPGSQFG